MRKACSAVLVIVTLSWLGPIGHTIASLKYGSWKCDAIEALKEDYSTSWVQCNPLRVCPIELGDSGTVQSRHNQNSGVTPNDDQ